jgi:prepilin-type N-terminal cleavage/methylation domain-containing protein
MDKLIKQAFTLIELLVVIAIIGILSGLIVVSMGGVTQKANVAKAQVFSNSLRNSLMANIVGEWKMDDINGSAAIDTWGGLNNGTLYSFTDTSAGYGDSSSHADGWMSSINCVSGTCLKFDGNNDYVGCGSGTNLQFGTGDFTISLWRKRISAYKSYSGYLGTSDATAAYAGLYESVGGENFEMGNGAVYQHFPLTNLKLDSITNSFQHITIVVDRDNKLYSYLNGQLKDSISITLNGNTSVGFSSLIIGSFWAGRFDGIIDEVRVYKAALSASQINEQYYAGLNSLFINGGITKDEYLSKINLIANE